MRLIWFLYGCVFGSYFNVVGYRLSWGSIATEGRSACPKCNHKLTWTELIPLVSYIMQKGRCKKCKHHIAIVYPIIECTTGLLYMWSYLKVGWSVSLVWYLLFISFGAIISVSDYWHYIIPNRFLIVYTPLLMYLSPISWKDSLLGICIQVGILWVVVRLTSHDAIGMGDVKLLVVMGGLFGLESSLMIVLVASIIAMVSFLLRRRITQDNCDTKLPFGPCICFSATMILMLQF